MYVFSFSVAKNQYGMKHMCVTLYIYSHSALFGVKWVNNIHVHENVRKKNLKQPKQTEEVKEKTTFIIIVCRHMNDFHHKRYIALNTHSYALGYVD